MKMWCASIIHETEGVCCVTRLSIPSRFYDLTRGTIEFTPMGGCQNAYEEVGALPAKLTPPRAINGVSFNTTVERRAPLSNDLVIAIIVGGPIYFDKQVERGVRDDTLVRGILSPDRKSLIDGNNKCVEWHSLRGTEKHSRMHEEVRDMRRVINLRAPIKTSPLAGHHAQHLFGGGAAE
jgi:hypothetical protein